MNNHDFIYNQIYKGSLKKGASEKKAKDHAVMGLSDYKKNKYESNPSKLIEYRIKLAAKGL